MDIRRKYSTSNDQLNFTDAFVGTKDILHDAFNADSRLPRLIIPRQFIPQHVGSHGAPVRCAPRLFGTRLKNWRRRMSP